MLYPKINDYCQQLETEFDQIPQKRKEELQVLSRYLQRKYQNGETPKTIVICTHNSRRSHMGQLWLAAGADYYQLPPLQTYSGGTEATAFNHRSVAALGRVGFDIYTDAPDAANPIYQIQWTGDMQPYLAFSKKFDDAPNPTAHFAAIMVCTEADEACPYVPGTDLRLPLPYTDPKAYDNTELEAAKYDERCRQIGREILYVLREVRKEIMR